MGNSAIKGVGLGVEMGVRAVSHGFANFHVRPSQSGMFKLMANHHTNKPSMNGDSMLGNMWVNRNLFVPADNKLPVLSRLTEPAVRLHNGYDDDTAGPEVDVFHEPEDLHRLLSSQQKYKYLTGQNQNNPEDVKIFLCKEESGAHKTLSRLAESLGYQVIQAGRVKGSPETHELTQLDNSSGHYQPRQTLPEDQLPGQFQITERAFAKLGWTGYGKSYLWSPRLEKYLPDNQYTVDPKAVEFRPGSSTESNTKSNIVNES